MNPRPQSQFDQVAAGRIMPCAQPRRIAFYSHDTQGLGHIRRNIALAAALVRAQPKSDVLLLTGNPEAATLALPANTDIVTLPTLSKDAAGDYVPRVLKSSLRRVVSMRAQIIDGALKSFEPDLFVVDKVAIGVQGELEQVLTRLRGGGRTQVVLGLREILDSPEVTIREWEAAGTSSIIDSFYDQVWVYGDRTVYDMVALYRLPVSVTQKLSYTGYLGHGRNTGAIPRVRPTPRIKPPSKPFVLCLVGGGQDGFGIASAFAAAPLPSGHQGVILSGPFMPDRMRTRLREMTCERPDMQLLEYIPDSQEFIDQAVAVVSMAGYNSVCELLTAGARCLLIPRVFPRLEQWVRADRLARLGHVDMMQPEELTATGLGNWMTQAVETDRKSARPRIDLDGLAKVSALAADLMGGAHRAA